MEKPGMGGGRRNRRAGLLTMRFPAGLLHIAAALLLLPRLTTILCAQDSAGPRVLVRTSPDLPLAGSVWAMTLLIDHPVPEEVIVQAPPLGETLLPDQILRGPYTAAPAADSGRPWTAIEYRFIPNSPGVITLDSFTVITPEGRTRTPPLAISVQGLNGETPPGIVRLVWDGLPQSLITGEAAAFSLRAANGDSPPPLPEPELFMPPVPEGCILESTLPAPGERNAGIALRLNLIPLDAGDFVLPARTVPFGNTLFEIPLLRVPVLPAPPKTAAADTAAESAGAGVPAAAVPFPETDSPLRRHPFLAKFFREAFADTRDTAKDLWDRGYRAESLAELRRKERDHPAGPLFRSLREAAELRAALAGTGDERPRYARLLLALVCLFPALAVWFLRVRFPPWGKRAGLVCAVFFAAAGLLCLYRFAAGGEAVFRHSRSGVLRETALRRVPDPSGETTARFREGWPVRLSPDSERTGSWVWVTVHGGDGASGWVQAEDIVVY